MQEETLVNHLTTTQGCELNKSPFSGMVSRHGIQSTLNSYVWF